MPQLDTSTWLVTILSALITLLIIMQLKVSKHLYSPNPEPQKATMSNHITPWETKWTKIYSPLSLPLQ